MNTQKKGGLVPALEKLRALQTQGREGFASSEFSRRELELLVRAGFVRRVLKGWYVASSPADMPGDSTPWYAHQMGFIRDYANRRFGNDWSLSPEDSLLQHSGRAGVRRQVIIHSSGATNNIFDLPFETRLIVFKPTHMRTGEPDAKGVRVMPLAHALCYAAPQFFVGHAQDAQIALSLIKDSSELLAPLLEDGKTHVAGRLAGAMRAIGREHIANDIMSTMRAAGFYVQESNPFEVSVPSLLLDRQSPYINRLRLMWAQMREQVLEAFDGVVSANIDAPDYLADVQENYVQDAYHSMSIEGYRVSEELIRRVAQGGFDPELNDDDRNAMAAKGYHDAFMLVKGSVAKILDGQNSGAVAQSDHREWYRALFGPSVQARILEPHHLAGYRAHQVYIRNSRHTPPPVEAVRDLMPVLFQLLESETEASVKAVMGHFALGYIHPWMDGNGRMARFLMNTQLAAGGYPWIIIHVEDRERYMRALELASNDNDLGAFAGYVAGRVSERLSAFSASSGSV